MTGTNAVLGTAQYLSPEQAKGETVDNRSDLYSTACLRYELLTGRPPFIGDSPVSLAYQHVGEQPQPPSSLVGGLPPDMDRVVIGGLAKAREQRYQSADEFIADLDRVANGLSVAAPFTAANAIDPRPIGGPDGPRPRPGVDFRPAGNDVRRARPQEWYPQDADMIEATALHKSYGGAPAVRDVSFTCPPGTVTGLLGPNGAGKSTVLRMICGLTRPDTGTATVAGVPFRALPDPGRVVGSMLDAGAQHGGRSGRETLRLAAMITRTPRSRVEALLDEIGLAGRAARKRVATYSLGMRQRLGIAQALIGDPSVLVLDEPANGLDPEGIRWMREFVRTFADRGGTVLLSSHQLNEVGAVADRIVVVVGGRVVAAERRDALLRQGEDVEGLYFRLTGAPAAPAQDGTVGR